MARLKGLIVIEADRCKGCGLCAAACPVALVSMNGALMNAKGYQPATIADMDKCIGCGYCALVCPDVAITVERREIEQDEHVDVTIHAQTAMEERAGA